MKLNIAVLAGDGIGPEIMKQGVAVMQAIAEKFNHEFTYNEAICGAHAIDEVGDPFPEETFKTCMDADAVLLIVCPQRVLPASTLLAPMATPASAIILSLLIVP